MSTLDTGPRGRGSRWRRRGGDTGTAPPGTVPAARRPADTRPGDTPPGDTPPGDTPPGDTPPGDTPPGDTAAGTATGVPGGPAPAAVERPPRRDLRAAGWAGAAGTGLFIVTVLALDALRRGEFDAVATPMNALAVGPYGPVMTANFLLLGAATAWLAVGLHRGLRPSRFGVIGPVLLGLTALANVGTAVFPVRIDEAGQYFLPPAHSAAGMTFFAGSVLALLALAHRIGRDPAWADLRRWVLAAGVVGAVGFVLMAAFVIRPDAPLFDLFGVIQRVFVVLVLLPARVLLGLRLARVGRGGPRADPAHLTHLA